MTSGTPEPESVDQFLKTVEDRLLEMGTDAQRIDWVYSTHITGDTEALASRSSARYIAQTVEYAKRAARFSSVPESSVDGRKLRLLRLSLSLIAPSDTKESEELTGLVAAMQATYAKGTYTPAGAPEPLDLQGLSRILGKSRDPRELEDVWNGWHAVARPMRPQFSRYVELANRGAREVGFPDTGAMWRSKYDMTPEEFERDCERVWLQVRPLYQSLHAYVRTRLRATYGEAMVPAAGPLPAHLLGNMWAQTWEGVYPLVAPPQADPGFDLTAILRDRGTTPTDMVRYAERFFSSLGFAELPSTFWERSLFVRPRDREVVCHASAWDIDSDQDLRIKMCIEITAEDFGVIHHELGHNYYQRAYRELPFLFRDSANDGFHEAVGDTIALSVTPEYLVRIGLLPTAPDPVKDLGLLMGKALEKIAFLPFGLLVDQWRWKVFDGQIPPEQYNASWWAMRREYQGITPPGARTEAEFDPGAKFHVAGNVPYMRYFLAAILQFQFHRALARTVGWNGPLHRCSIYGNREAGGKLIAMLEMGQSRPWPEALEALTGERKLDATAMLEYFAPLQRWLDEQNRGHPVGW